MPAARRELVAASFSSVLLFILGALVYWLLRGPGPEYKRRRITVCVISKAPE